MSSHLTSGYAPGNSGSLDSSGGGYASYCLCRVNFVLAQPLILREFPAWTSAQIGSIPSTYAVAYAAGQIVNGTLGER